MSSFMRYLEEEEDVCGCSDASCDILPPWVAFATGGFCFFASLCCQGFMNWHFRTNDESFKDSYSFKNIIGALAPRNYGNNRAAKEAASEGSILFTLRVVLDCLYTPFFLLGFLQRDFSSGIFILIGWGAFVPFFLQRSLDLFARDPIPDRIKVVAYDVYEDIGKGVSLSIVVFLLQVLLGGYYSFAVYEGGRPCFESARVYFSYAFGALTKALYVSSISIIDIDNASNGPKLWAQIHQAADDGYLIMTDDNRTKKIKHNYLQHILSFIANDLMANILFLLMNIEMAHSENGLEFVLNFAAVFTITEYDDLDDPEEYEIFNPNTVDDGKPDAFIDDSTSKE